MSSVFGVMEIKRSFYHADIVDKLNCFLADVRSKRIAPAVEKTIVNSRESAGLGVVCVLEKPAPPEFEAMVDRREAIALFELKGEELKVRKKDVLELINFLQFITWQYRKRGASPAPMALNTDLWK